MMLTDISSRRCYLVVSSFFFLMVTQDHDNVLN